MAEATKSAQEAFKTTGSTAQSQYARAGSRAPGQPTEQMSGEGRVSGGVARQTHEQSSYSLNKTWEQVMNYSRENPGKSTLIAFGVGVGVGLLMVNGFTTRSRSERIVPPLMNALSEIASALFR